MARPIPCTATLLAVLLACAPAALAQRSPGTVPEQLAAALLPPYWAGMNEGIELLVDRAPDGFPSAALPEGAEVMGAAVSGGSSIVAAAVRQEPAEAMLAFAAGLEAAGWRPQVYGPGIGFRTREPEPDRFPDAFCREGAAVRFHATPRSGGGSILRAELHRLPAAVSCDGFAGSASEPDPPSLLLPESVVLHERMWSNRPDGWIVRAALVTDLAPAALLAHFAAQMERAGWVAGARTRGRGVATQRFAYAADRRWQAILVAAAIPGTSERDVSLRVIEHEHPPAR